MNTFKSIAFIIAAALPVALFGSSATDTKIEDAAKASYNYRTVLEDHVKVKSNDGVVTLTGTVQLSDEKSMAEDTVSNLPGVVSVDNQIVVAPDVPEHSDAWIALKVRTLLLVKANVSVAATTVHVNNGVVTLTGTVTDLAQKELTELYVKDVENVKSVNNELVVTPATGSTVGEVIDDASITSQVKYALLSHRATSSIATKVVTQDGIVMVTGVAGSETEKSLVTKLAQDTRGVKSVTNQMTVRA